MCLKKKIIIVGAGPIGLYLAKRIEEKGLDYIVLEASKHYGGQCRRLYPKKPVGDVPFIKSTAQGVVDYLKSFVPDDKILYEKKIIDIKQTNNGYILSTGTEQFEGEYVIIATGLGYYSPIKLGVPNVDKMTNIYYRVKDPEIFKDKEVVIFGGGDSALDWAATLSTICKKVSLVHRRTEFRGNPETIKGKKIDLYLPYVPYDIDSEGDKVTHITIRRVTDSQLIKLKCDAVIVNFGQMPEPSPFHFKKADGGFGFTSDSQNEIAPHLYVAGDCSFKENKPKRMEPGFEEADRIVNSF